MKKIQNVLIAFLLMSIPFLGYCTDDDITEEDYENMVEAIVSNEDTCVKCYEAEKIYLNTERLYPSDYGMYLDLNGRDYAILPAVNSDSRGCYIRKVMQGTREPIRCPGCGNWTDCSWRCKTPGCSNNKNGKTSGNSSSKKKKKH